MVLQTATVNYDALERDINSIIGKNLYCLRVRKNLKQQLAAEKLGVSISQLKKYEQGKETLRLDIAYSVCLCYGISMSRLFVDTPYAYVPASPHQYFLDRIDRQVLDINQAQYAQLISVLNTTFSTNITPSSSPSTPYNETTDYRSDTFTEEYFFAIGKNVRALREKNGLSQLAMAEGMDISLSAYQRYESPQTTVRFSVLIAARFAKLMKINPLSLITNTHIGQIRQRHDNRLGDLQKIILGAEDKESYLEQMITMLCDHWTKS